MGFLLLAGLGGWCFFEQFNFGFVDFIVVVDLVLELLHNGFLRMVVCWNFWVVVCGLLLNPLLVVILWALNCVLVRVKLLVFTELLCCVCGVRLDR